MHNLLLTLWFPFSCAIFQDNPLLVECFDFNSSGDHVLIGYVNDYWIISYLLLSILRWVLPLVVLWQGLPDNYYSAWKSIYLKVWSKFLQPQGTKKGLNFFVYDGIYWRKESLQLTSLHMSKLVSDERAIVCGQVAGNSPAYFLRLYFQWIWAQFHGGCRFYWLACQPML